MKARRSLAAAGATALLLALVPAAVSADAHTTPEARGVDLVCPPESPTGDASSLEDIDGTTHQSTIECVVGYSIARGFADDTFRPNDDVTRGQAATFLANLIETATAEALVVPTEDAFPDVGSTHAGAINALEAVGIVDGRNDGTYGTGASITRGQMASVVARAIDFIDSGAVDGSLPPADATEYFADSVGSTFQADIQALAGVGIVVGNDGVFDRTGNVTRGHMASFVVRSADYLGELQRFFPTAVEVTYDVTLAGANEVDTTTGDLGAGEPDTTATAEIVVDAFNGTVDFDLGFGDVTGPFAGAAGFHIHEGGLSENGDVVVFFATGAEVQAAADDDASTLTGTFDEDADEFRLSDLINDPDGYYLNLHSEAYPNGAVRGQLPAGGQNLLQPVTYDVTLTGAAEVDDDGMPDQGQLDATASAQVTIDAVAGTITHTLEFGDVTGPFVDNAGYHIHVGAANENGPVVLFLGTPAQVQGAADDDSILNRTVADVDPALLRLLIDEPENYYLNLHSEGFPAGAVRAQLDSLI